MNVFSIKKHPRFQTWKDCHNKKNLSKKITPTRYFSSHVLPSAILYLLNYYQKIIRSLDMPREPLHKRYRAYKLFRWLFFQNVIGHLVFNGFFSNGNQIIRSTQRTTTSNLNAIQQTVHKISCPQAFRVAIFLNDLRRPSCLKWIFLKS